MPFASDRRALLRELYGFEFPDDLFRFWDFANRLRPLEPLQAFHDPLGITLVGPFDVLAGRCDRRIPKRTLLLHWRYYDDPPEFFTIFSGDTDGLHWGYYLDNPSSGPCAVASYFARDAFELSVDGDTPFEALRLQIEYQYRDCEDYIEDDPENEAEYRADMSKLDRLRSRLPRWATTDRPEIGLEYTDRWTGAATRNALVIAETVEGMGVVGAPECFRPLSRKGKRYLSYLRKAANLLNVVEEARAALRDGFPLTSLKVGKDLWALGGKRATRYAYELLDGSYAALGRESLRQVLAIHRENRDLPTVDVFEDDAAGNGHA
jgi:hypothetical protein